MKNPITSFAPVKTSIAGFLLFALFIGPPASAAEEVQDYKHYEQKLEKLHKSIDKVKKHLKTTRYKRGNVITDLKKLEGEISKNARALQSTEARIKSLNQDISRQKSELREVNAKLKLQREQLGSQIRAAYAVGSQEQIKMLLNQQQPAEMGRVMVYFDYLNRARQEQISLFIENIEQKQRIEASLNAALLDQEKTLAKRKNTMGMLSDYMPDLVKAVDRLGRLLFLFYWHNDDFQARYGKQKMYDLEQSLKDVFSSLSDTVVFLKEKTTEEGMVMAEDEDDLGDDIGTE